VPPIKAFIHCLKELVNCGQVAFDENSERGIPEKCVPKFKFLLSAFLIGQGKN